MFLPLTSSGKKKKTLYVISTVFFSSHAGSLEAEYFFCAFQPFLFHSLMLLHQLITTNFCSFSLLLALRLLSLFHFKKNFILISCLFQLTSFIYPFRANLPKIMINTWPPCLLLLLNISSLAFSPKTALSQISK